MSNTHNKWLDWKIRNGLAHVGKTNDGRGPLNPVGWFPKLLHRLYYKRYDEPRRTTHHVG